MSVQGREPAQTVQQASPLQPVRSSQKTASGFGASSRTLSLQLKPAQETRGGGGGGGGRSGGGGGGPMMIPWL